MKFEDKKLSRCLGIPEKQGVTAIVGGGGKTSLMYALAAEFAAAGGRAAATTTTKIYIPERDDVYLPGEGEALSGAVAPGRIVCVGTPGDDGKLRYPGDEKFRELCRLADRVFVEADGARHCPVKAPGENEPVIPAGTDSVIAVAGLDALGRKIADASFRHELVCRVLDALPEDILTPRMLARLLTSSGGQQKNIPDGADFAIVLNKADDELRRAGGEETAELIRMFCPGCRVLITALEQEESIKALYI